MAEKMGRKYKLRSGKITANLFKMQPQDAAPLNAQKGDMYLRSTDGKIRVYTGSAWETVSSS